MPNFSHMIRETQWFPGDPKVGTILTSSLLFALTLCVFVLLVRIITHWIKPISRLNQILTRIIGAMVACFFARYQVLILQRSLIDPVYWADLQPMILTFALLLLWVLNTLIVCHLTPIDSPLTPADSSPGGNTDAT